MKYELIELKWITERGNVALIKRGEKNKEYAVVRNLDTEEPFESDSQWDNTIQYYSDDIEGLQKAVDCFRRKSEYNYIPRCRLEELATNFKDYVYDNCDDEDEVAEEWCNEYELTENECNFFGIGTAYSRDKEDDDYLSNMER